MRRALQGFITVMTFIAADPGMAHTGSSSVINAKQANHTSGVYSGTQGFGISPYNGRIDYTTDSEYSYFSSAEGESCTLEEMEEEYSVEETARIEALRNRAVECFSTRLITERLVINLTAYTEIKLYRVCKYIYLGNRARINWWVNMDQKIQKASGNDSDNNNNAGPSSDGAQ